MKKRYLGIIFSICVMFFSSFLLSACGDKGPKQPKVINLELTCFEHFVQNESEIEVNSSSYSAYNKLNFKDAFRLTEYFDNGNSSVVNSSNFEIVYEDENIFNSENSIVVNNNSETKGYKLKVTYKTYSFNFTIKFLRKQLNKPYSTEDISFSYDGTEKNALDYIGIENLEDYIIDGTYKATQDGNYQFTLTLKDDCVWYDNTTNTITINWVIDKTKVAIRDFSFNNQYFTGEDYWKYIQEAFNMQNGNGENSGIKLCEEQPYTEYKNVGSYDLKIELFNDTYKWADESIAGNTYLIKDAFEIIQNKYDENQNPVSPKRNTEEPFVFSENMNGSIDNPNPLGLTFDFSQLHYVESNDLMKPKISLTTGMYYAFVANYGNGLEEYEYRYNGEYWELYSVETNSKINFIPANEYEVYFHIPEQTNVEKYKSTWLDFEVKHKIINDILGVDVPTSIESKTYTGEPLTPDIPTSEYWTMEDLSKREFINVKYDGYDIDLIAKENYAFRVINQNGYECESNYLTLNFQITKAKNKLLKVEFNNDSNGNFVWEYVDDRLVTSQKLQMPKCTTLYETEFEYYYRLQNSENDWLSFDGFDNNYAIGKYELKIVDLNSNDGPYICNSNCYHMEDVCTTFEITPIDLTNKNLTFKTKCDYYWANEPNEKFYFSDEIQLLYKDGEIEKSLPSYVYNNGEKETFYILTYENMNTAGKGKCIITGQGKYKGTIDFPITIIDSLQNVKDNEKVGFQGTTTLTQPLEIDKNIVFNIQGTVNTNLASKNLFTIVQPVNVKFITNLNGKVNFTSNEENASLFEINHSNAVVSFEGLGEFNASTSSTNRISAVNLISGEIKVNNSYENKTCFASDDIGIIVYKNGIVDFNWAKIQAKNVGILMLGGVVNFKSGELHAENTGQTNQSATGIEIWAGNLILGGDIGYLNYNVFAEWSKKDNEKFLDVANPGNISAMIVAGKPEDITNCGGDITITINDRVYFDNLNNNNNFGRGILRDITYNIKQYNFKVVGLDKFTTYSILMKNGNIVQESMNGLQIVDINGATKGSVANEAVFASFDSSRPYDTLYSAIKLSSYIKDGVTYKLKDAYLEYLDYKYSPLTEEDVNGLASQTVTISGVGQFVGSFTFEVKYIANITKFEQGGYSVLTDGDIVTKAIPDDFTKPFEILGKDLTIVIPGKITSQDIQGAMTMPLATGVTNVSTIKERSSIYIGNDETGKVSNVNIVGGGSLTFAKPLDSETYYGLSVNAGSNVNLYLSDFHINEFSNINIVKDYSNFYCIYTKGQVNYLYSNTYLFNKNKFMVKGDGKIVTSDNERYLGGDDLLNKLVVPKDNYSFKGEYNNEDPYIYSSNWGFITIDLSSSASYSENNNITGDVQFTVAEQKYNENHNFVTEKELLNIAGVQYDGNNILNPEGFNVGYDEKTGIYRTNFYGMGIPLEPTKVILMTKDLLSNCSLYNIVKAFGGKNILRRTYTYTEYDSEQNQYVEKMGSNYIVYDNNKIIKITVDSVTNKIKDAEISFFGKYNEGGYKEYNFVRVTLSNIVY